MEASSTSRLGEDPGTAPMVHGFCPRGRQVPGVTARVSGCVRAGLLPGAQGRAKPADIRLRAWVLE